MCFANPPANQQGSAVLRGIFCLILMMMSSALASATTVPPAIKLAPTEEELASLRQEVEQAKDRRSWEAAAWTLLDALDRKGASQGAEALWIVDQLLTTHTDHPILLWRRGGARRRLADTSGAMQDFERLVKAAPSHPLAARALRALPALYLRDGFPQKSAAADERLIQAGLADPVAVLTRLARTYAVLGDAKKTRSALERLYALDPDRVLYDPDIAWYWADAAERTMSKAEAARVLLRFANVFPRDPRRVEAFLRAARQFKQLGASELALRLTSEAIDQGHDPGKVLEARIMRAELYQEHGLTGDARYEYQLIVDQTQEGAIAARALRRLIDMDIEEHGRRTALLTLAAFIQRGDGIAGTLARNIFETEMNLLAGEIADKPEEAVFYHELARRIDQVASLPRQIQLDAAALRESIGDNERAAALYSILASRPWGNRSVALAGLARTRPLDSGMGAEANHLDRLEALARDEEWAQVSNLIEQKDPLGVEEEAARKIAARAAFAQGRPQRAAELLEPIKRIKGEAALLRGDARALDGRWTQACDDYRRARDLPLDSERRWLEVRMAACEFREKKIDAARIRLEAILGADPPEPVAYAAMDLLSLIPRSSNNRSPDSATKPVESGKTSDSTPRGRRAEGAS